MKTQLRLLVGLLFIGLGYGGYAAAESAQAKKLIDLNETLIGQKQDWFDFMKKTESEKTDLIKKHHQQWANWRNQNVKNFDESSFATQEAKNAELEKQFKEELALHKAQSAEWATLMRGNVGEAEALAKKHAQQIEDKFEPKPKKTEKEAADKNKQEIIEISEEDIEDEDLE